MKVGVTGLEPATAWSQTRNATNCATPRKHRLETSVIFKCGAKVRIILELSKFLRNFLHHYRNFLYFCGKEYLFSRLFLYLLNPSLRILGIRIQVEGFLVVGYCGFVHLLALTFLTHYGIFHR